MGNSKDKVEEQRESDIYKTLRKGFNKCYIEEINRNIGVKFKEHLRNIKKQEVEKSLIEEHLLIYNHTIKII